METEGNKNLLAQSIPVIVTSVNHIYITVFIL